MKKLYTIISIILFAGTSCTEKVEEYRPGNSTSDVELRIVQASSGTRTEVPYPSATGTDEEKRVVTLDIIAFDATTKQFVYTRPAYPTAGNVYRATVPTAHPNVDVVLIANCPAAYITNLLASTSWTNSSRQWEDFRKLLVDDNPKRLVNPDSFQPLPMSTSLLENKELLQTGISNWGTAQLFRSVASVDVVMEKNIATSKFEITKVHAYYAAGKGYIPAIHKANTSPQQYETPADMETSLQLTATQVGETQTGTSPNVVTYDAITSQLFMYDNNIITDTDDTHKPTRVIIEGYYDQAGETGGKTPSYYPVFLVDGDNFRPVIRNYKYLLKINAVYGPGYKTITEAAESSPVNLNLEVIDWNLADVEVGVSGPYYVSINKKIAILDREAGSEDKILLTYEGEDADVFTINFKTDANGSQASITSGIANNRFEVTLTSANLIVKAKGDYSTIETENNDIVILTYRNLRFEIAIHQLDKNDDDWVNGGEIPSDL